MKSIKFLFVTFFSFLTFSCIDYSDDIEEIKIELNELKEIQNLLQLKNLLYQSIISEELVTNISKSDKILTLFFENGNDYKIDKNLVLNYEIDYDNWRLKINLSDNTLISLFFLGNDIKIQSSKLNPYNTAPLSLVVKIETPVSGKFKINVFGQDGPNSNIILNPEYYGKNHKLEIFGLYPNYNNKIDITFTSSDGQIRKSKQINVKTSKLPEGFPDFDILKQYDNYSQNTLILINYRVNNIPFMVDPYGKIRWYSTGFSEGTKYGLQKFKNGNIGFGTSGNGQGKIYEYNMTGEIIKIYNFYPEYENAHHDVFEMSNGNFLVPVNKVGIETIEDHIIEIDRLSGSIENIWDLRQILQMDRFIFRKIKDGKDWFHVNAVIHDETDNSIIVSGQAQGLAKISWNNELKWILSPHDGWDNEYMDYLLLPISNPFEWSWGQHAPNILPNGNLMLFDNGFGRNFTNLASPYSRVVEYNIEENNLGGNISQVWEYGKERGDEFYSPFISDVDYLPATESIFITAGATAFDIEYSSENTKFNPNIDEIETRIIELNKNKEILFEMTLSSKNVGSTYRSEKIKLD